MAIFEPRRNAASRPALCIGRRSTAPTRRPISASTATGTPSAIPSSRWRRRSAADVALSSRRYGGAVPAPGRGALVGGAGGKDAGVVARAARGLEGERKAVAAEAATDGERGLAGDVERHGERSLAEEMEDRLRLLEDLRRAPVVGGHDQVVAAHGGARVQLQLAAEAQG